MAIDIQSSLDFGNNRRILNLPDGVSSQQPATVAQLNAAIEGLKDKLSVKVATQGNISLASPGTTIDSITMVLNDRVLVKAQTDPTQNGIYLWNGAGVAMTRSADADTGTELSQAITTVEQGTSTGITYRQTVSNGTIGSTSFVWITFGVVSPAASDTLAGIVEIATQLEVDTGTDTQRVIVPATLKDSIYATKKITAVIGDGSATLYTVTHNFNTLDTTVQVTKNTGNYDNVLVDIRRTINTVSILFDSAPAINSYKVMIRT